MHDAWYFSVACLPDSVKAAVAQHLNTANIPQQYRIDIQGVIDFMNRGASTDGFITRMKIADLDRKRRQNFAMVSPDMAKLLEYNLDDC
jgi:hypothetical protein